VSKLAPWPSSGRVLRSFREGFIFWCSPLLEFGFVRATSAHSQIRSYSQRISATREPYIRVTASGSALDTCAVSRWRHTCRNLRSPQIPTKTSHSVPHPIRQCSTRTTTDISLEALRKCQTGCGIRTGCRLSTEAMLWRTGAKPYPRALKPASQTLGQGTLGRRMGVLSMVPGVRRVPRVYTHPKEGSPRVLLTCVRPRYLSRAL
jgi:hypothetical protein